jgi:hypothetical protein
MKTRKRKLHLINWTKPEVPEKASKLAPCVGETRAPTFRAKSGSVIERSQNSLKHVADGLSCLRQLDTRQIQKEEEEPKMAHPFTAIPMPYATLTSVAVSPTKAAGQQTDSENQWQAQLLTLLYEKAMLVLAVMLQHSVATEQYGAVLRQVQNLLVLNLGLQKLNRILGVKQVNLICDVFYNL